MQRSYRPRRWLLPKDHPMSGSVEPESPHESTSGSSPRSISRPAPRNFSGSVPFQSRFKVLKAIEEVCKEGTEKAGYYSEGNFYWAQENQGEFALSRSISRVSGLSRGAVGRVLRSGYKANLIHKTDNLDLGEGKRGSGYNLTEKGKDWLRGAYEKFGEH